MLKENLVQNEMEFNTREEFENFCQMAEEYLKSVNDQLVGAVTETVSRLENAVNAGVSKLDTLSMIAEEQQKGFQILADEAQSFADSAAANEMTKSKEIWLKEKDINIQLANSKDLAANNLAWLSDTVGNYGYHAQRLSGYVGKAVDYGQLVTYCHEKDWHTVTKKVTTMFAGAALIGITGLIASSITASAFAAAFPLAATSIIAVTYGAAAWNGDTLGNIIFDILEKNTNFINWSTEFLAEIDQYASVLLDGGVNLNPDQDTNSRDENSAVDDSGGVSDGEDNSSEVSDDYDDDIHGGTGSVNVLDNDVDLNIDDNDLSLEEEIALQEEAIAETEEEIALQEEALAEAEEAEEEANEALEEANEALEEANEALEEANEALAEADEAQEETDETVAEDALAQASVHDDELGDSNEEKTDAERIAEQIEEEIEKELGPGVGVEVTCEKEEDGEYDCKMSVDEVEEEEEEVEEVLEEENLIDEAIDWVDDTIDETIDWVDDTIDTIADVVEEVIDDIVDIFSGDDSVEVTNEEGDWEEDDWDDGGYGGDAGWDIYDGDDFGDQDFDPLVLDLDNDGIELVSLDKSNAYFDLKGNGFAIKTSWVSGDDGLLVLDSNSDGAINNINELFGNAKRSGFDELSDFDSNADGKISIDDEVFSQLQLWKDSNCDGISQSGELYSLSDYGIASINLDYTETDANYSLEGMEVRKGNFQYEDGHDGNVSDVGFAINTTYSNYVENYAFYSEVLEVSNIKGYGEMADLHIAMSLDQDLKQTVLDLFNEPNIEVINESFERLLIKWAGCEGCSLNDIEPESQLEISKGSDQVYFGFSNESFTLEQLGVLKKYAGLDILHIGDNLWHDEEGMEFNQVSTGDYYRKAWNELYRNLLAKFVVANGLLADEMLGLTYDVDTDLLYSDVDLSEKGHELVDGIISKLTENPNDKSLIESQAVLAIALSEIEPELVVYLNDSVSTLIANNPEEQALTTVFDNPLFQLIGVGSSGDDNIYGTESSDHFYGYAGDDIIKAHAGDDVVHGGKGDDTLNGDSGSDNLSGDAGNDTLNGGVGDDTLTGGAGNDTLKGGIGNDHLSGGAGDDVLYGDPGSQVGNDVLDGGIGDDRLLGGAGDDILHGDEDADTLNGGSGNDQLFGDSGDDYLVGAEGEDILHGAEGEDTLYGGAGNDVIHGGSASDMLNGGTENDQLFGDEGNDQLFGGNGDDQLVGAEGDDKLNGDDGDDLLDGGAGNDRLKGGSGNDQLLGGIGDDILNGQDGGDILLGGEGHDDIDGGAGEDVLYGGAGNDILNGGTENDQLFGDEGNDQLFGDDGNDQLVGGAGEDILYGGDGSDVLLAGAGNDVLKGGNGNDILNGGSGNDSLEGGTGDDIYHFGYNSGRDTVKEYSQHSTDKLIIDDIDIEDLWFSRSGKDLVIDVIDSDDQIKVKSWFAGSKYQLDEIRTTDEVLYVDQVQQLVSAMAAFDVPETSETLSSSDTIEQVHAAITAGSQFVDLRTQ